MTPTIYFTIGLIIAVIAMTAFGLLYPRSKNTIFSGLVDVLLVVVIIAAWPIFVSVLIVLGVSKAILSLLGK